MSDQARITQIEQELAATEEKAAQLRAQLEQERGAAPPAAARPGSPKTIQRSARPERE